jgi:hypothetical protein
VSEWVEKSAFSTLKSVAEIDKQIALREEAIRPMVGWLYPSILRDELQALSELRGQLKQRERECSSP